MTHTTHKDSRNPSGHSAEISSARLLGPKGELVIIHNGERYTLRITANRKLILTK